MMFRRLALPFSALGVAALALSLALPASARRGVDHDEAPTEEQLEVRKLRKQIAAEELTVALQLSEDQADELSDVIADVLAQKATKKAARQERISESIDILESYLKEVRRRGEPSDKTVESLQDFRAQNRPDRDALKAARKETRERVRTILSQDQLKTLKDFRPMSSVRQDEAKEQDGKRGRRAVSGNKDSEGEAGARRGKRKKMKIFRVLFSEEMLDALSR